MPYVFRPVARLCCVTTMAAFTAGAAIPACAQDAAPPSLTPVSALGGTFAAAATTVVAAAPEAEPAPGILSAQLPGPLRRQVTNDRGAEQPGAGVFRDLFAPLGGDLVRPIAQPGLLLLGIGAASAVSARPVDRPVAGFAWPTATDPALDAGKYVGNSFIQMGGALAAYTVGRASGSARTARVGAMIFRAQVVAEAYTRGLKLSTSRTRPDGTAFSFPSGHSSSSFATATVLASEFGPKVGIPAYAVAAWVAASRLEARRHFLSDVVAGAAVGILAGRSITIGSGNTKFAMTPIVPASGAGIGAGFTKVAK